MAPKVGSVQSDPTYCWRVATLTPLPRAPLFLTPKSDPRDPVAISFREPYVAVGDGGNAKNDITRDAAVLGDHADVHLDNASIVVVCKFPSGAGLFVRNRVHDGLMSGKVLRPRRRPPDAQITWRRAHDEFGRAELSGDEPGIRHVTDAQHDVQAIGQQRCR